MDININKRNKRCCGGDDGCDCDEMVSRKRKVLSSLFTDIRNAYSGVKHTGKPEQPGDNRT